MRSPLSVPILDIISTQHTAEALADLAGTFNTEVVQKYLKPAVEAARTRHLSVQFGDTVVEAHKPFGQPFHVMVVNEALGACIDFCGDRPCRSVDRIADLQGSAEDIRAMVQQVIAECNGPVI